MSQQTRNNVSKKHIISDKDKSFMVNVTLHNFTIIDSIQGDDDRRLPIELGEMWPPARQRCKAEGLEVYPDQWEVIGDGYIELNVKGRQYEASVTARHKIAGQRTVRATGLSRSIAKTKLWSNWNDMTVEEGVHSHLKFKGYRFNHPA